MIWSDRASGDLKFMRANVVGNQAVIEPSSSSMFLRKFIEDESIIGTSEHPISTRILATISVPGSLRFWSFLRDGIHRARLVCRGHLVSFVAENSVQASMRYTRFHGASNIRHRARVVCDQSAFFLMSTSRSPYATPDPGR